MSDKVELFRELMEIAKGELADKWPADAMQLNEQLLLLSAHSISLEALMNEGKITKPQASVLFEMQKNYAQGIFHMACGLTEQEAQSLMNVLLHRIIAFIIGGADWIVPG